jgi:ABC-2 type transport system permease protein/oleandomycin transport system permease protein
MSAMSTENVRGLARLQPASRPAAYWAIADALTLAKRRLIQIPRIWDELIFATIQPIMFVLLFRYVFGGSIHIGNGVSYVNFLMAGIFTQTVIFGATTTGVGLANDLEKGLIDRFRSLPMAKSAVLTGRTLADLARNAFVVVVMWLVGLAVGFRPQGNAFSWLGAIGLLLLYSFAFSWISATIGLIVSSVEAAQSAGFIWLFPLTFASSAFAQPSTFPTWLRSFANAQPVTSMVDAVRGLLLNNPDGATIWKAVAWSVGILVVFIPLSVWAYGRRIGR